MKNQLGWRQGETETTPRCWFSDHPITRSRRSPDSSVAAAAITYPAAIARREIDEHFKSSARNFLGSGWSFYELRDGRAFWIHKSGKVVPSSRNTGKRL